MGARISSDSVRKATGRDWDGWLETLDAAGAKDWDHKQIVAHLEREHGEAVSAWWRQSITVEYEQARGKRAAGEKPGGFDVGVQRSIPAPAAEVWELITSRPELWLGEGASAVFEKGESYDAPDASGEVRVVKPGERLRLTWQPEGWPAAATLQLTLTESAAGKTALRAHLEKLPDEDARDAMRAHWGEVLERVSAAAAG
jgi:uncharacterized protein YndB with AHSA1/START domain